MHKYCLLIIILLSTFLHAQDVEVKVHGDSTKHFRIKPVNWDTVQYRKYNYVFIVGYFSQYRVFNNEIISQMHKDTLGLGKQTYVAQSGVVNGLVFNYDKFQIAIGGRPKFKDTSSTKGRTQMFNIGVSFGDNRYVSESYYRRFTGFYNSNRNVLDSLDHAKGKYYLEPNMRSSLFMTRIMYFTRYRGFSYKSGFGCNYRQLKSAFTWIYGANYSTYTMLNDSSVIPDKAHFMFNEYSRMRGLRSYNLGVTLGAAGTLVLFKAWFINGSFTFGPEQQWRDYDLISGHRRISYISGSGTGRFSAGLNMKKFYMLVSITNDYNLYNSSAIMKFKSEAISHNFTFGWRFHSGEPPQFYKRFQQTKFYKLFG